ncbi:MAG: NAD-dependent epimerase/dehydratase family protein [Bradymonadia bacterium]
MKLLITGGSGRIGRRLVLEAAQRENRVIALCRPGADTRQLEELGAEVILGDTTVPRILTRALRGCDAVIHAAGVRAAARESTYQHFNIQGTIGLAEAASQADIQACVFISTLAAQGPSQTHEPHTEFVNEAPIDAFGKSMLAAEKVFMASAIRERTCIIRPGLVCGTEGAFIQRLVGMVRRGLAPTLTNPPLLSLVHVNDVAIAALNAAHLGAGEGQRVYVSNGEPVSFNALLDEIEKQLAVHAAVRLPLPQSLLAAFAQTANRLTESTGLFAETTMTLNHLTKGNWYCSSSTSCAALGNIDWMRNREIVGDAIARASA